VDSDGLATLIFEGREVVQSITNVGRTFDHTRKVHSIR
jgi:hypothetical protein